MRGQETPRIKLIYLVLACVCVLRKWLSYFFFSLHYSILLHRIDICVNLTPPWWLHNASQSSSRTPPKCKINAYNIFSSSFRFSWWQKHIKNMLNSHTKAPFDSTIRYLKRRKKNRLYILGDVDTQKWFFG